MNKKDEEVKREILNIRPNAFSVTKIVMSFSGKYNYIACVNFQVFERKKKS